uniref:(northern house mosquito) hypothetical protein n=1 Tax=Culex pipiens TaxID=7175 RepID=A0A8D8FNG2_CULPI
MLLQKYACTRLVSTCSFLRLLSLSLITELLSHTLTLLLLLPSSVLPLPYLKLLRFLSPSLSFLFCYSLFLRLFPSLPLLLCRYALLLSLFALLSSRVSIPNRCSGTAGARYGHPELFSSSHG